MLCNAYLIIHIVHPSLEKLLIGLPHVLLGPEYVENIVSRSLKKTLVRETTTIKKLAIFQNFNFGMLKLTKTPILPNHQVPNVTFVNLTIRESKVCKVAQLFIVSVSLVRGLFEGTR